MKYIALALGVVLPFTACALAANDTDNAAKLEALFQVPAEYQGKFGNYPSPLKFYDGRPVKTPADWPKRRAEILKYWHTEMAPWPELLAHPKLEIVETVAREGLTQHKVRVEVAPGVMQDGYLML